ncbi:MAG: bifunctional diaminohydroxyphosphoribosylaminopyrimidine deaminase/5-amino-6-(5-phosphoribosylamino)uracil reductase RibD, partial [Acidimicrobiia bacterium]
AVMRRAIDLARNDHPHPNPRVGAVVLDKAGKVIGEGSHLGPGSPHAEVVALQGAQGSARGGTVIVTLEPCTHQGRTPPCVEALLEAGVARVVIGAGDPDPRVSGRGIAQLRSQGLEVEAGVLADEAEALDPSYFHHRRTGRPRITLKAALTLDGQIAAADRSSRWITGDEAREDAHRQRSQVDAVIVGGGTVISDDPRLDVRLPGYGGPQPRPVLIVGKRTPSTDAAVFERNPLVIAAREVTLPGERVTVDGAPDGRPDLKAAFAVVGEHGYLDVLVESGPGLAASLWRDRLIDRGVFYLAGRIAGGQGLSAFAGAWNTLEDSRQIEILDVKRLGSDLRIDWISAGPGRFGP